MARQALIERRPWLLASMAAAASYYFLSDNPVFEGVWGLLAKGASVGLLAVYALLRLPPGRGRLEGALLVAMLALAAAGDVGIELDLIIGGALFAASHSVAIVLYRRKRDTRPAPRQKVIALGLLMVTPAVSFALSGDARIAAYGLFLGAMAAAAWMSNYPRYRVGAGALLFVASDWLLFSRLGPLDLAPLPNLLIWPLYYCGQVMIATGLVQCLRGEQPVR